MLQPLTPPSDFWSAFEQLIAMSTIVIDRPRDSAHPRYPGLIYPVDYGYLESTTAGDGQGIDLWRGTDPAQYFDGIVCTVDLFKRDAEIKLLMGCTPAEKSAVRCFYEQNEYQKWIMIPRPLVVPD